MISKLFLVVVFCLTAAVSTAEPTRIVTDIAPVNALVKAVAGQMQSTDQLIQGAVSAHDFTLKPSHLRKLQAADLIVWMGPSASPGLAKLMTQPALAAKSLTLEDSITPQYQRSAGIFDGAHPSGHLDPHAWLDPDHGRLWAALIADALQTRDPGNAEIYRLQSLDLIADITAAEITIRSALTKPAALPYIQFHDAFQYFETHFGLTPLGAATTGDQESASLGIIGKLRSTLANHAASCIFVKSDAQAKQARPLLAATGSKIGILDPIGRNIPDADYTYPALLLAIMAGFEACLY